MSAAVQNGTEPTVLPVAEPALDMAHTEATLARTRSGPPERFGNGPKRAAPEHRHSLLQAFQSFVYIVIIALFIITFTVQPFRIPSQSMEPTLQVGDFLLVNKQIGQETAPAVFAPSGIIRRGDMIVFHYPVDPALHLVKRVVGLPGDRLRLRDGHVFIDGRAQAEPYAVFQPTGPDNYRDDFPRMENADPGVDSRWWVQMRSLVSQGELTVPRGSYFVLGDNRNDSEDSRYWGFVPEANIVGKPFLIYFSLKSLDRRHSQNAPSDRSVVVSHSETPFDFARWDRALRVVY